MSTPTLFDTIQHWLQGAVNDATAGYASRIERLEDRIQTQNDQINLLCQAGQDLAGRVAVLEARAAGLDDLWRAHNKLSRDVQAMLVPQTMDADTLLQKLRGAENWHDAITDDVLGSPAFTTALNEEVFEGHKLDEAVKAIVGDLDFKVSVR